MNAGSIPTSASKQKKPCKSKIYRAFSLTNSRQAICSDSLRGGLGAVYSPALSGSQESGVVATRCRPDGEIGRRRRLKISRPLGVPVRFRLRAPLPSFVTLARCTTFRWAGDASGANVWAQLSSINERTRLMPGFLYRLRRNQAPRLAMERNLEPAFTMRRWRRGPAAS